MRRYIVALIAFFLIMGNYILPTFVHAGKEKNETFSANPSEFSKLPVELQVSIFEKVGLEELEKVTQVSKEWKEIGNDVASRSLKKQFFPEEITMACESLARKLDLPKDQGPSSTICTFLVREAGGTIIKILTLAKQGKVLGSAFGIGDTFGTIKKSWGKPELQNNCTLYYDRKKGIRFDSYFENGTVTNIYCENKQLEDISPSWVKGILGSPDDENIREIAETYIYGAGKYKLTFRFDGSGKQCSYEVNLNSVYRDNTPVAKFES